MLAISVLKMRSDRIQTATACLLFIISSVASAEISCTSPGSVLEGSSLSLTCSYNQNLQEDRQDFYIYRQSGDSETVIVAICAWETSLSCNLHAGYNASVQGPTVSLNISSARAEHTGNYTCVTLPPKEGVKSESCSLSVATTVRKPRDSKITCFAPSQLSSEKETSVSCIIPDSLEADYVSLERSDHTSFTDKVELLRCNKGSESCRKRTDKCQARSEHITAEGYRMISAKVSKPGRYVCRAGLGASDIDSCTMDIAEGSEQTNALDGSLHTLTVLLYAILGCFVLVFVFGAIFLFIRLQKSKNWSRARSTSAYSAGLLATHSPIYKKPLRV